jgi:hypothetical protein
MYWSFCNQLLRPTECKFAPPRGPTARTLRKQLEEASGYSMTSCAVNAPKGNIAERCTHTC